MAEITYVSIGYTQKTHGVAGELKLTVEPRYLEDFLKNERLFVDVKGVKVPYFIENMRGKDQPFIVKFEDVDTKEAAFGLQSREIFLRQGDLLAEHERELEVEEEPVSPHAQLSGYLLVDEHLGEIGIIEEIFEMPHQEMAAVRYREREVLVPLHPSFLRRIDEGEKKVFMDLPEGLID